MQHAACHMRLISPTVWGLRWCNSQIGYLKVPVSAYIFQFLVILAYKIDLMRASPCVK